MSDYMRLEMWEDRMLETISSWEKLQDIEVPEAIKNDIMQFMRAKVIRGIKKGTLIRTFMQIAVSSLVYIKMKRLDQ